MVCLFSVFCRSRYILCWSCNRRGPPKGCCCHRWNCADFCQQYHWWGFLNFSLYTLIRFSEWQVGDEWKGFFSLINLITTPLINFHFLCLYVLKVLGSCELFEERQVGNERFNIFSGCPSGRTATIVLRGGADQVCHYERLLLSWALLYFILNGRHNVFCFDFGQFIEEAERSLHDAIMIVRRALKNSTVVAGGGAIDVGNWNLLRRVVTCIL